MKFDEKVLFILLFLLLIAGFIAHSCQIRDLRRQLQSEIAERTSKAP